MQESQRLSNPLANWTSNKCNPWKQFDDVPLLWRHPKFAFAHLLEPTFKRFRSCNQFLARQRAYNVHPSSLLLCLIPFLHVSRSKGAQRNVIVGRMRAMLQALCAKILGGLFFLFFVFQPGFMAFVASVASVAFVGVWLLWPYHALPIYLSI